ARSRDILVAFRNRTGSLAGFAKLLDPQVGIKALHFDSSGRVQTTALAANGQMYVAPVQREPISRIELEGPVHEIGITVLAVGREPHHLVLFAKTVETDELTGGGI